MSYTITLAAGILLFFVSLFLAKESLAFIRSGKRTVATVVEIKEDKNSEGNSYRPIFSFKTDAGEEIKYTYPFATNPRSWDIGDEATIVYNPFNPYHARVLRYFSVFGWSIACMVAAMVLIVIGGGYYLTLPLLK